jgi:hypothetical protein
VKEWLDTASASRYDMNHASYPFKIPNFLSNTLTADDYGMVEEEVLSLIRDTTMTPQTDGGPKYKERSLRDWTIEFMMEKLRKMAEKNDMGPKAKLYWREAIAAAMAHHNSKAKALIVTGKSLASGDSKRPKLTNSHTDNNTGSSSTVTREYPTRIPHVELRITYTASFETDTEKVTIPDTSPKLADVEEKIVGNLKEVCDLLNEIGAGATFDLEKALEAARKQPTATVEHSTAIPEGEMRITHTAILETATQKVTMPVKTINLSRKGCEELGRVVRVLVRKWRRDDV